MAQNMVNNQNERKKNKINNNLNVKNFQVSVARDQKLTIESNLYKLKNLELSHSSYRLTVEECFIVLTKTEMLKGSKKFKSRIFYSIK